MINRKIIKKLELWKKRPDRKPLILRGARQVGKTWAVRMFGKTFANFIELNLERAEYQQLFTRSLPIKDLWQAILLAQNTTLQEGNSLLFIDEIQHVPEAVAKLRYFYEELPCNRQCCFDYCIPRPRSRSRPSETTRNRRGCSFSIPA